LHFTGEGAVWWTIPGVCREAFARMGSIPLYSARVTNDVPASQYNNLQATDSTPFYILPSTDDLDGTNVAGHASARSKTEPSTGWPAQPIAWLNTVKWTGVRKASEASQQQNKCGGQGRASGKKAGLGTTKSPAIEMVGLILRFRSENVPPARLELAAIRLEGECSIH
jgi:hypothetical protein